MIITAIKIPKHIQNRGLLKVGSTDRKSPEGLFSSAIFGDVSTPERKLNGGYIALNCNVVRPNVLEKLKVISRVMYQCATEKVPFVFSARTGLVKKENFVDDGATKFIEGFGPEFLYNIWDEIDLTKFEMEGGSHINRTMKLSLQKKSREDIFTAHQYVMALAFREEPEEDSVMLQNEINVLFSNLVKLSNITSSGFMTGTSSSDVCVLIQKAVQDIYNYYNDRYMGPKGAFRKNLMSRSVANSSGLTIVAGSYNSNVIGKSGIGVRSIGTPLQHCINMYKDFFIKHSRDFLNFLHERGDLGELNIEMLDTYDTEYLNNLMSSFGTQHTRVQPFELIQNDGSYIPLELTFEVDIERNGVYIEQTKYLSNMEFFYIVALEFMHIHDSKAMVVTRYPTDSTLSTQFFNPFVTTLFQRYLKPTKVCGMSFDMNYPYVDQKITSEYYMSIFEEGCRVSHASVVGFNGDFDGDKVSLKPVLTEEGVTAVDKIQKQLLFNFDHNGNFRKAVARDGAQTLYSLSREPKDNEKPKAIDTKHEFITYIMNVEDFDIRVIYKYMANFEKKSKPDIMPYDTVTVTINKKKIETTVGRLILNSIIFRKVLNIDGFNYINTTWFRPDFELGLRNAMYLEIENKIPKGTMNDIVDVLTELSLRLSTVFNASCTYEMLNPDSDFVDFRNEAIGAVEDEVRNDGNIGKLKEAEAKVLTYAKKKFKNDDMNEIYSSKNTANWDNHFRSMNVDMGALPSITGGKASIITRPLSDGMQIEDMADLVNTGALGAYARGCQTALGGALYKQITNSFGNIKGVRGDCGNTHSVTITIDHIFDEALGRYIVKKDGSIEKITTSNIAKYVGKEVEVRDPFYCKSKGDTFCSTCVGDTPFDILGMDTIPLGTLSADISHGILNMFMKMTHSLSQEVFKIEDLNKFLIPYDDIFEIKMDIVTGKNMIYVKEHVEWRIPALSVSMVDSDYVAMAHGSILSTENHGEHTLVLGTEVTTRPTSIVDYKSKHNDIYKHYTFKYEKGDVFLNDTIFYRKETTVHRMFNLFMSGNVSTLTPKKLHLTTFLNTIANNKKVNASMLTCNVILSTLIRDAKDISKPARETESEDYVVVSSQDLVDILGGTFEALFSGDVNRGLFITSSKSDKEQRKETSATEKAFYY